MRIRRRLVEAHLTLKGRNIPFIIDVKYLDVIFAIKFTWRMHIESITTKAFRTFVRIYLLLKSERLSTSTELTLYKAFIGSIISYVCTAWEFAADNYLLKLQRMRNKVLHTVSNLPRRKPNRALHLTFKIPYDYDYASKI